MEKFIWSQVPHFSAEFSNLDTTDFWARCFIAMRGCPRYCKMLSVNPGLYSLDARTVVCPTPQAGQSMSPGCRLQRGMVPSGKGLHLRLGNEDHVS